MVTLTVEPPASLANRVKLAASRSLLLAAWIALFARVVESLCRSS